MDLVFKKASKYYRKQNIVSFKVFNHSNGQYPFMCGNCENNNRTAGITAAINRKILFIVWGSTDYEDPPTLKPNAKTFRERSGTATDMFFRMARLPVTSLKLILLAGNVKIVWNCIMYLYYGIRDSMEIKASRLNPFRTVSLKNIENLQAIYFYDYISYDIYNHIKTIKKEVNWEAPVGKEDKMDCKISAIANYQSLNSTGITGNGRRLASLIKSGLINRDDALEKETIMKKDIETEYNNIYKELCDNFGVPLVEK